MLEVGNAWFAARQANASPTPSAQDQRAATLTQAHANTPGTVHFDTLGRPAIGVENNGTNAEVTTTSKLDIEGNPLKVVDARGNIAADNKFDLLGRTLYTNSCDAGARWSFSNVVGNPIRVWDSRDHVIRSVYDDLHRRIELWVKVGSADEVLAEQTIYGEGQTDPEVSNLRGKVYQVKDGAGVLTNVSYDFKGNLLSSQRQLAVAYSTQLDWSDTVTLETETFVQTTVFDALNRPTQITMPYPPDTLGKPNNVVKPIYNEAGLLESVTAHVRGATGLTTFVDDIDYDAKGQREKIVYGNGVYTEYSYDPETYRVKRIKTTRDSDDEVLQDLRYTYDAVGNIVEVADLAHETFYHGGHEIKAVWQYEYDALYRLTYATGREHVGTNDDIQQDDSGFPLVNGANPNDPSAMRNYEEWFEYDKVGNILKMIHDAQSSVGDWTRHYHVAETSNRLLDTSLPGDDEEDAVYSAEYTHDAHGNMLTMPHLDGIDWDFKDQMHHVDKGGGGDVYFVYDASGQRIRKVWEHSGIIEERIYLGGFELYRRRESGDVVLERETLHIMDDAHRIAMVETKTIDEAADPFTITPRIRYQLGNHLGSAMLELDHEGLVISYEEYHPYGTSAYRAVDDSIEVSARRYRYTGKERDEETGLYYHGARYYACWLARWTSADPAGMVDGPNLFQYVRGRPIGSWDPSGMQSAPTCTSRNDESGLPFCPLTIREGSLDAPSQTRKPAGPAPFLMEYAKQDIKPGAAPFLSEYMATQNAAGALNEIVRINESMAPTSKEGIGSFLEGAALGGFSDNNSWSAIAGSVVIGFIPIVGQIADIRDIGAAIGHIAEGKPGGWLELGASVLGLIPGGDVLKGIAKGTTKGVAKGSAMAAAKAGAHVADEVGEGIVKGAKSAADEIPAAGRLGDSASQGRRVVSPDEFEALAQVTFGGQKGRLPLSNPRPSGVVDVEIDLISNDTLTQIKRVTAPNARFGGKMIEQFEMTIDAARISGRKNIRYVVANETPQSFIDEILARPLPAGMQLFVERLPAIR